MKTLLLLLLSLISMAGFAQVNYTIVPRFACENTTHDIVVSATNNQGNIPAGLSYTVTINVKDNTGTTVKTFTQTYNDGFPVGTTKTYVVNLVAFGAASTWKIGGNVAVTGFGTFPVPDQDYLVKTVPVLTIINSGPDLSVVTNINGYSVRYYLNGDYGTIVNESTNGMYTAVASGTYSANAVNYVFVNNVQSTCISASPSNDVAIIVTAIGNAQNDVTVSVYPNPMSSTLILSSGIPDELTYELYDKTGAVLYKAPFKQSEHLDVANLKAGSYVLIIKKENQKIASYNLVK